MKYRVMAITKKHKCCGKPEWINIGTTYDPIAFQAEHPTWVLKFERCILK